MLPRLKAALVSTSPDEMYEVTRARTDQGSAPELLQKSPAASSDKILQPRRRESSMCRLNWRLKGHANFKRPSSIVTLILLW